MNKGVEILLARMNSNPEEFIEKLGDFIFPNSDTYINEDRTARVRQKWDGVIQKLLAKDKDGNSLLEEFLTKEEVKALYDKYLELIRNKFTQSVMKRLFEEEKPTRAEALAKALGDNSTAADASTNERGLMTEQETRERQLHQYEMSKRHELEEQRHRYNMERGICPEEDYEIISKKKR